MKQWKNILFKDLLAESKDGEWGKGEEEVGHTLCEVIRGTDFANINEPNVELPQRWIKDHLKDRKQLKIGDVLLETAGGTAKQSTGRSTILRKSFFDKHKTKPVLCSSFSRHLRLKKEYNSEFIYYLLQTLYDCGFMAVYNIQHTGVSRFQYTSFKNKTALNIPPLETQKTIAAVLSAYDDLIENNKRRIALLENMAEEIYREWFVRFRFPGWQNTELEKGIPKNWNNRKIREIVSYYIGGGWGEEEASAQFSEGAYVIRGTDIPSLANGDYSEKVFRYHKPSNLKSRRLKVYDFIFEVSGGSTNQLLGRNLMLTEELIKVFEERVMCASFCKQIRFNDSIVSPYFIKYFLKLYYECDLVGIYQVQSTGISNYQFESFLSNQNIIIPEQSILKQFEETVKPIVQKIGILAQENMSLSTAKKMLLPRLISGKLSVEELDIAFPPSMQ